MRTSGDWNMINKIGLYNTHYIAASLLIAIVGLVSCSLLGSTMELPNTEDVTRIEMGSISITSQDDVDIIIYALSGAKRISGNAWNEHPPGEDLLNIYLFVLEDGEEVMWLRAYLYADGNGVRLWNSYVGEYSISPIKADRLRQLYYDLIAIY